MYKDLFWAHVCEPKRQLKDTDPPLGAVGTSFYQRCGDKLELHLDISPADSASSSHITRARFHAKGCAPVIAVADLGCSILEGLTADQARELSATEMDKILGPLPLSKRHAYLLFLECLHGALDQANSTSKGQNHE